MRWDISEVASTYIPSLAGKEVTEVEEMGERFLLIDQAKIPLEGIARTRDEKAAQVVAALRKFAAPRKP